MKYNILEETSNAKLRASVASKISEGWIPQGGVSISPQDDGVWWYAQAMILTDKEERRIEAERPE